METNLTKVPLSLLDLCTIRTNETPRDALQQAVALARHAEALGFKRFWVTEHHGDAMSASAATAVVVGHIADRTSSIRVGSGGIMLPNHSPLVIAEQFGTLASLYPGRIDLGLGRSTGIPPGNVDGVLRLLRHRPDARGGFGADLEDLQSLFRPSGPGPSVRAIPGTGLDVPIWLLGSSVSSAKLAASLGLPYVFATHIGPSALDGALDSYRTGFRASEVLDRPHVMVCVIVVAAETDEQARHLFTSIQQAIILSQRGSSGPLPPAVHDLDEFASREEQDRLRHVLPCVIVGAKEGVREGIGALLARTQADELMILTFVHDLDARRRSLAIVAEACDAIRA
jgi:luciferase family oxidoreductase group 1